MFVAQATSLVFLEQSEQNKTAAKQMMRGFFPNREAKTFHPESELNKPTSVNVV